MPGSTPRWDLIRVLTGCLLLAGCGSGTDQVAPSPRPPTAPAPTSTTTSPSPAEPAPEPEPVRSLASEPFSGYRDVDQEVRAWRLSCPPELTELVPEALTMGTAERDLDGAGAVVARQVAVFASVDEAVAAADRLVGAARELCPGAYEPEPGFVVSTTTVEDLDVGVQGVLVGTTAEDGVSATAVLRRGNAVALVQATGTPVYPEGRSAAQDARDGAADVFAQLCEYEQGGC